MDGRRYWYYAMRRVAGSGLEEFRGLVVIVDFAQVHNRSEPKLEQKPAMSLHKVRV
jgi:hypothetical protein